MLTRILILCGLILCGCNTQQQSPQPQPYPPGIQQFPPPIPANPAPKLEGTYSGPWVTTNRRLEGKMKCDVTQQSSDRWTGHFYGVWMGRKYEYTVNWTGTPENIVGTAVIDGASYRWTGQISETQFKVNFTGNRYNGYFDLKK